MLVLEVQIGKCAAAVSRRISAKFADFTKKDPPRAALAALAVGAIIGWVAGFLCRD
jgi:ribose/xylose/arabinose/galactoside ABC-type transport system permease subunit